MTQEKALTQTCWHPDFALVASTTVSNKCSVFIRHSVCGILLWQSQFRQPLRLNLYDGKSHFGIKQTLLKIFLI